MIARSMLLFFVVSLSGCGFSFKSLDPLLAGETERAKQLGKTVRAYHQAVYWSDGDMASGFVAPEVRASFIRDLSARKTGEKLVDIKVASIDYEPENRLATVNTVTKYYQIPTYQVKTRYEKENWKFDRFAGGWRTTGVNEVEESAFIGLDQLGEEQQSFRGRLKDAGGRTFNLD